MSRENEINKNTRTDLNIDFLDTSIDLEYDDIQAKVTLEVDVTTYYDLEPKTEEVEYLVHHFTYPYTIKREDVLNYLIQEEGKNINDITQEDMHLIFEDPDSDYLKDDFIDWLSSEYMDLIRDEIESNPDEFEFDDLEEIGEDFYYNEDYPESIDI